MRTPVRVGIIAMVTNMALNLLLVIPLHAYWQIGHVGLAAATSISAFINTLLLFLALRRDHIYRPAGSWLRFFIILLCAVTAMLVVLIILLGYMGGTEAWQQQSWWQRVFDIILLCCAGFMAYAGSLFMAGFRLSDFRGPAKMTNK